MILPPGSDREQPMILPEGALRFQFRVVGCPDDPQDDWVAQYCKDRVAAAVRAAGLAVLDSVVGRWSVEKIADQSFDTYRAQAIGVPYTTEKVGS